MKWIKRTAILFVCAIMITVFMHAIPSSAGTTGKKVRVGWHEAPYFIEDESGRRTGYTYDYQQKIAAYTGWNYEYVEGSWGELMQKLMDGEIDMMGNVSYMDERAGHMLYSSIPMGTESYYLMVPPGGDAIKTDDYSSVNGKKIGVAKGTIQSKLIRDWMQTHGVQAQIIEVTTQETESLKHLGSEFDGYVTMDVHVNNKVAVPAWKIGSSDFFFALSKSRSDLLNDLNYAMSRIQDENKFFEEELHEKYLKSADAERYISDREKEWLEKHGTIRVGYQDNYLAFCAKDEETGELTGALRDYLDYASTALENVKLDFEPHAYPTASEAIEALKDGEIDCVFPANLTYHDSEELGVVMTPALMSTEMDAVVRASEQKEFLHKKDVKVAVNKGNTNYDLFLREHYPDWETKYYDDTPTGLDAVAAGDADCVIISNYRFSNISKQCESLHLTTVYTGVDMDYYLAVRKGDTDLYSILSRITSIVPDAAVHTALTYYSTEDVKTGFFDYILDHLFIVMAVIAAVLAVIVVLLMRSRRAEKKAREEERIVDALNQKVYVDALTSVQNQRAFEASIQKLQERIDSGEDLEFAIGIFDCDNLKKINDQYGHERGNEYLKNAATLICKIFQRSPVFRIGGDEFAIILLNQEFRNREALLSRFEKEMYRKSVTEADPWGQTRVSTGIAVYDRGMDYSVSETVARADKIMYANKRAGKRKGDTSW